MRVTAADYESLKAFFAWMLEHVVTVHLTLPESERPLAVIERFESESMAIARKSLAMGLGDIIEMTDGLPAEQIDTALAAEGLLTLSAVRARFSRAIEAIMRRGAVRNEGEYYALRNAVDFLPEDGQRVAWRLLGAFEEKLVRTQ